MSEDSVPTIILMRHGQVPQASPRRFVGQRDLPLDRTGEEQAETAGKWLQASLEAGPELEGLVCSDLQRCRDTAGRVARGLGLQPDAVQQEPGLREISLGEWEGLSKAEVQERFPGALDARGQDLAGHRPQGGESFADLQGRVSEAFARWAAETASLRILVAHAGANRALLCGLLGMPLQHVFRLGQDYCCVNVLRREGQHWTVQHLNVLPWAAGGVVV